MGLLGSSYISLTRIVPDCSGGWGDDDRVQVKDVLFIIDGKSEALLLFFAGCVRTLWCFHGMFSTPLHTILTEIDDNGK